MEDTQAAAAAIAARVSDVEGSLTALDQALGRHDAQFAAILTKLDAMNLSTGQPHMTPSTGQPQTLHREVHATGDQASASVDNRPGSGPDGGGWSGGSLPRMDLPMFDGTDPIAWLAQAEQYFLVHRVPLSERV